MSEILTLPAEHATYKKFAAMIGNDAKEEADELRKVLKMGSISHDSIEHLSFNQIRDLIEGIIEKFEEIREDLQDHFDRSICMDLDPENPRWDHAE